MEVSTESNEICIPCHVVAQGYAKNLEPREVCKFYAERFLKRCISLCKIHTRICGEPSLKAVDQGRPLEGARVHYDILLTTVK